MSDSKNNFFERFSNAMTQFTGSSTAFIIAVAIVVVWGISGPIFQYSETWQLVINTGTTIITFLMVFLIQKAQNKDGKAIQLKLNELLAATKGASNRMVSIEDLNEEELDKLHRFYEKLANLEKKTQDFGKTHSIDAAETSHNKKYAPSKQSEEKAAQPMPKRSATRQSAKVKTNTKPAKKT
ncbi:MAG TPA: low affinity iron permease family protein [Pelobium sp.]